MTEAGAGGSAEFAERMIHTMNDAALALMVSVGHRTGLFDVMAGRRRRRRPIASSAALNKRYVREWLAVMTTGRIVDHDGATGYFSCLPITPHGSPGRRHENLATGMQYIGLLAWSKIRSWTASAMAAEFRLGVPEVSSCHGRGQRRRSRRHLDRRDVAARSRPDRQAPARYRCRRCRWFGHAVNLMAGAFPHSRFTGFDFSDARIAAAQAEADRQNLALGSPFSRSRSAVDASKPAGQPDPAPATPTLAAGR